MFGIGTEELILIFILALLVLGPERMPKIARDVGRVVGDLRRTSDELREEFLNADRVLDAAARSPVDLTPQAIAPPATEPPSAPATEPTVAANASEPTVAAGTTEAAPVASAQDVGVAEEPAAADGTPPDAGATEAAVGTAPEPEPDETAFDRDAREAREKLHDPERMRRAAAEGWPTPIDEAGTSDRWG